MTLSSEGAERIVLLHQAAKHNGSMVSLREISRLMPEMASEEELAEAIALLPALNSKFQLRSGYLTELSELEGNLQVKEPENRARARFNMEHARRFASCLRSNPFKLVGVSGSTSYGSASSSTDLDLFCVSPPNKMWISLTLGLIMSRAYHLAVRGSPKICLSCVMDQDYARSTFSRERGALFARDAIETKVLKGKGLYISLMKGAGWIAKFYPFAYKESVTNPEPVLGIQKASAFDSALNRLLFTVIGRYMRFKSSVLNRKLARDGMTADAFVVHSGEDHLIYESNRYSSLREEYDTILTYRRSIQN